MIQLIKPIQIVLILISLNNILCLNFPSFNITSEEQTNYQPINNFLENIERIASNEVSDVFNKSEEQKNYHPEDCSQREKLKNQPSKQSNSRLKKCCPIGESLSIYGENQNNNMCDSSRLEFKPNIINVVLYDNCIEDNEIEISLLYEIGNPCNTSIVYNNLDDIFYVLQDGSLLIMDEYANTSYTVEEKYCLDVDNRSGTTYAFICITQVEEHLKRGQIITVAILMLISIPCLLFLAYLHLSIKELRSLHGLSLSSMSLCLAIGYFLHSLAHIYSIKSLNLGYIVQFFVLSYFFWFFCLCCNVLINIWIKIPMNKGNSKTFVYSNFIVFILICFTGPLVLVILTAQKGLPGMPSYFLQGLTESIRESQRYFIPPVSTLLFLSFLVLVISFFGFQRIKKRETTVREKKFYFTINTEIDEEKYEEVKKDAKCISLLNLIMVITWMLEIVTFYSPGPENYLILLEMINGIQGILISLIFLVVRRRRTIILRWWYDRGSHNLENVELSENSK
ncbi:probable G-protein coupled receptor Mth-like 14 [Teleopsis dalmanni]|uniref:probable G-protein coupled receptor Mth-like 14 n=1 Tax=Teleopsis dalmanni TaxID=139649 RepID=UPI0018CDF254|nr:probable G-protein coupled receptor Mth-like 14 [Teleopsis dalmanni]